MATAKYPSRIRYEESHPSVTFRVSREDYERLDAIREKTGKSFREIVMYGAGLIEKDLEAEKKRIMEASEEWFYAGWERGLEDVHLGICPGCGEEIGWNLNNSADREMLDEIVNNAAIHHTPCIEEEKRSNR